MPASVATGSGATGSGTVTRLPSGPYSHLYGDAITWDSSQPIRGFVASFPSTKGTVYSQCP